MICNLFIDVITHLGDVLTRVINHKGWSSKYVRSLFMVKLVVYIYLYLYLYLYIYIYQYVYIYIYIYMHTWISNHFPKDSFPLIESTPGPVGTSAQLPAPPELPTQRGKRSTTIGERMHGYDLRWLWPYHTNIHRFHGKRSLKHHTFYGKNTGTSHQ